ncbi:MAG: SDR family NAD(P)-dependent oxidoreductase [Lentisphaerae bacterium]|nr:SDR family NAD(P)-dependent oxidoreductase [Lentisphaerota bacterium]
MPTKAHKATPSFNARLLTVLRGLLAEPSGNPDRPWQRVLLKKSPPGVGATAGALTLKGLDAKVSDDELRSQMRSALQLVKAPPVQIVLPGGNVYSVERGAAGPNAPLQNEIALVTGAAGAIGEGICRGLLAKGAHVAATDLAKAPLQKLVAELEALAPGLPAIAPGLPSIALGATDGATGGRVLGVTVDVTDEASVAAGFDAVTETWGGVDIVVVNAGIAAVASLVELELDAFRRLERVNVEGTLLTLAEAGRRLGRQATGGDIILISTRNVFAPGAQFGAYSATKAAGHQLARIASLEMAGADIRVNMVAPDAVFGEGKHRSGLWAAVGPARMLARGLDEKGLEEYYRNRNLLKARITPEHVANAVLFFATRQTPTTGATLPVDGGLPDATPR